MRSAFVTVVLSILALVVPAASGGATAESRLELNKLTEGHYGFCLSFEDARVHRDYLAKAISQGMSVIDYRKSRPKVRCYSNSIKFIPRRMEPKLDGVDYVYKPDAEGRQPCPKDLPRGKCTIIADQVRYIEATIIYSGNQFPIFVRLVDDVLVGANGQVVSQ
jgi:hypothetical protein